MDYIWDRSNVLLRKKWNIIQKKTYMSMGFNIVPISQNYDLPEWNGTRKTIPMLKNNKFSLLLMYIWKIKSNVPETKE